MIEDAYFWSKNGRPSSEKDHDSNSLCHQKMRFLKKEGVLLKTYHLDFGEGQCGKWVQEEMDRTLFHQDIAPYVRYSINKRKRWEVEGSIGFLGVLQKMYADMEVSVIERVRLKSPPYTSPLFFHNFYFSKFKIKRIHKLIDDTFYQCTSVNSVYGQHIEHFSPENKSSTKSKTLELPQRKEAGKPKVAYHLISPPKNYEVLLSKRFHPHRIRLNWWWSPLSLYETDWKQLIEEDLYEALTYDRVEDLEWDEAHEWEEEEEEVDSSDENCRRPRECYNFLDHIVDKIVIVKRRKHAREKKEISN